jgi:uncharacterized membrane protein (UPF0127 family)
MLFAAMKTLRSIMLPLLTLLMLCPSCAKEKPCVVIHLKSGSEPVRVTVELAQTAGQRSMGLMYRKRLGPTRGMLFLFDREQAQRFTMRNTAIPLDMIFIDSSRSIAGIIENTKPYANGPFSITRPSLYVLEVNAGFCGRHGIAAGDTVVFQNLPVQNTP